MARTAFGDLAVARWALSGGIVCGRRGRRSLVSGAQAGWLFVVQRLCVHRRHVPPERDLLDCLLDLGLLPLEVVRQAVENADVVGLLARRRVGRVHQLHFPGRRLAVEGVWVRAPLGVSWRLIVVEVEGLGRLLLRGRRTRCSLFFVTSVSGASGGALRFDDMGGRGKAGTILEMTERWPTPV